MKRKSLFLLGAALLSAAIGYGVAIGTEVPPRGEKKDDSPAEKGVTKSTVTVSGKPARQAATKPVADSDAKTTVAADRSPDSTAILATGVIYVKAYAAGDAKAIAALFTEDAEYIDENGNAHQGREAIAAAMTTCFAANPGREIELDINSIRIVSPGVAIEDGVTTLTGPNDAAPIVSHYTAIHVKTNGMWLVASVREHAPKGRRQHQSQLRQLAWLQGEWVDEGEDSLVVYSCTAIDGGNFLLREFRIHIFGQEAMTGTQRIGWDPLTGKLKSWVFDSDGGYSEGFWHRDADRWVLKSFGVTADGEPASSTTIYIAVNADMMTWQSVDHEVAGVEIPDSEVVTLVRRAPLPQASVDIPSPRSN